MQDFFEYVPKLWLTLVLIFSFLSCSLSLSFLSFGDKFGARVCGLLGTYPFSIFMAAIFIHMNLHSAEPDPKLGGLVIAVAVMSPLIISKTHRSSPVFSVVHLVLALIYMIASMVLIFG